MTLHNILLNTTRMKRNHAVF